MATLKQLVSKRGKFKTQLSRFNTFLTSYQESELEQLRVRLERVEPLLGDFDEVQSEIEALDEDGGGNNEEERETFENKYFSAISKARQYTRPITSTPVGDIFNRTTVEAKIRLPQLNLPTFSGRYEEWNTFSDNFKAIIDNNNSLSDSQRFHYLRAQLSDVAEQAIKSLEVTDNNYNIAWTILRQRFENKRLSVNNHLDSIFALPVMTKENSTQLRSICDTLVICLRGLQTLKINTDNWDCLLIYIIEKKLDAVSRREFAATKFSSEMPSTNELTEFLNKRSMILESLQTQNKQTSSLYSYSPRPHGKPGAYASAIIEKRCTFCNEMHALYNCSKFKSLPINSRLDTVSQLKVCFNCLTPGHLVNRCRSRRSCFLCCKRHHTLLCSGQQTDRTIEAFNVGEANNEDRSRILPQQTNTLTIAAAGSQIQGLHSGNNILLSTAVVHATGERGNSNLCRVLLDSAAQSNFITEELCRNLNLRRERLHSTVQGIGNGQEEIKHSVKLRIKSQFTDYSIPIRCLVLQQITGYIPSVSFDSSLVKLPPNIILADSSFNHSGPVQILLGAEHFWQLLHGERIKLGKNMPILQNTEFGFIIAGPLQIPQTRTVPTYAHCALARQLAKSWEVEEIEDKQLSIEEQVCEDIFTASTKRDAEGRIIVDIPLRDSIQKLGKSRQIALKRFHQLESKCNRNVKFKTEYIKFMKEYETLGHTTEIDETLDADQVTYYIPHHGVAKHDSLSTRHRTVFDASAKTDTNISLNDLQYVGLQVQEDLFSIIVRFCKHRYTMTGDVEKGHRQILVDEGQRDLQRIFWRANTNEDLKCYTLRAETYGLTASAHLATRCLKQLAIETKETDPSANQAIENDFYVDDFLLGANTVEETIKLRDDVCRIVNTAKFNLRKWVSNYTMSFDTDAAENDLRVLLLGETNVNKTLGILWNVTTDQLQYDVKSEEQCTEITKRSILSRISKTFDPYGLLTPVTIVAKLMMQSLWEAKIPWDEPIQGDLRKSWTKFQEELSGIKEIRVPRFLCGAEPLVVELHGFSDAATRAYGAYVYLRMIDMEGVITVNLISAKSRVAPLRTLTIPRLELCAAVLLAKLANRTDRALRLQIHGIHYWCDSTIVLDWLSVEANKWKSFIAALRRFVGRRGAPHTIHSDNATNFVGAHNKMRDLGTLLRDLEKVDQFRNFLLGNEINWRFIPARSPNFGGLWERAVRSVKHHLTRVAADARLTFEEFYTLLVQVESIMNSRPLSPMTSNPDDLNPLTPGHFLIGRPLTATIDEDLTNTKMNRLTRLQLVQRMTQHFWSRWRKEYLMELQHRYKWTKPGNALSVGELVIVHQDNVPPCYWHMGRIVAVHPGTDGAVRVVSINTKGGVIKRSVAKVSVLPVPITE